ncbi:MAG TPA: hypothetical protein VNL92_04845, partial [Dehalococcoidia bacterium]|nr:hypothetical protein [Dehalococcoidia bacterium]
MPRKLVEAAFRHKLLLALPIVLVPALVFLFYPSPEDEYVSETTVWVETPSFAAQVTQPAPVYPILTPAQQQAEVLRQMLTTRSFRENAAIDAKLVTPEAPEADRSEAATEIGERISIVERGENLIAIEARGTSPQHAQALALGFLKEYNDRVIFEAGRTTQLTTDYYMGQLNLAQAELAKRRQEAQAYLTAHPKAYESKAPDFTYDSLIARVNEQAAVV